MDKTSLRLKLLANGYVPIPIEDKIRSFLGWPKLQPTTELIRSREWRDSAFEGTGLLLRDDLLVVDKDINDPVIDKIADRFIDFLGYTPKLVRYGKGFKEAWFFREAEPIKRWASRSWHRPGDPDDVEHRVEIFGTLTKGRYFGAYGPHTLNRKTGKIEIAYRWDGDGPDTIPRADLPVLTKQQIARLCDITDEVLTEEGWTFNERSKHGETGGDTVYDLTEDMYFDLQDGRRLSLPELQALAESDPRLDLRCSGSFLEGPAASNRSKCRIGSLNGLSVYSYDTATTHRPEKSEPDNVQEVENVIGALAAKFAKFRKAAPPEDTADLPTPRKGDRMEVAAAKLIKSYAFLKGGDAGSIYMGATSLGQTMSMGAFRDQMRPYAEERAALTPAGRPTNKLINPADVWLAHPDRVDVDGLVSAPGRPSPTFKVGRQTLINSYRPPDHSATGGSADKAWQFIAHLLPIPEELNYFIQWLGHKVRAPEIPGPSVIMVADNTFGTGRTTLGQIIEKLFGIDYVKELEFRTLSGETSQSQYNEWAATAVMVLVDESSETQSSQYKQRRNAYEFLKRHCDPRRMKRQITVKGKNNYQAETCTTFFIATNHIDAISIPENDRRFAVLSNGEKLPAKLAKEVNRWMLDPANIAALYHQLCAIDLTGYDPYEEPLKTAAKTRMATETMSDTEQALALVIADLKTPVVTMPVLAKLTEAVARDHSLHLFGVTQVERESAIKNVAKKQLHRIHKDGRPLCIMINGARPPVFAISAVEAERYGKMETAFVTRDVKRNLGDEKTTAEKLAEMHNLKGDLST